MGLEEEFASLRRTAIRDKMSQAQYRWMRHVEMHLDAGDLICACFEPSVVQEFREYVPNVPTASDETDTELAEEEPEEGKTGE